MNATGSYILLARSDLQRCLDLAAGVEAETTGVLFWKKTVETGREEFDRAWNAAVTKKVDFKYSGFALADYFTAQDEVNGFTEDPYDSPEGLTLGRAFIAAFPATAPMTFPPFAAAALKAFCDEEYGPDPERVVALQAAHAFYAEGMALVSPETVVAFVIA